MKNFLSEEIALAWGGHHYEEDCQENIHNNHAVVKVWFGKVSQEEDQLTLATINLVYDEDTGWCTDNYQIHGGDFHLDIIQSLTEEIEHNLDHRG
jgi:hypothetical protein